MLAFYESMRFDDVDLAADGDMLLYQWGTYDWGRGASFEFDITRQLILGAGEDEDISSCLSRSSFSRQLRSGSLALVIVGVAPLKRLKNSVHSLIAHRQS